MSEEINLLLRIWPVLIAIVAAICGCAIALYRISLIEGRMKEVMTTENHMKDCKIASLEIKDYFRTALAEFGSKLLSKMDEQQKPIIDAIKKNADMISRLDRRTRHLKDADA